MPTSIPTCTNTSAAFSSTSRAPSARTLIDLITGLIILNVGLLRLQADRIGVTLARR